MAVSKVNRVLSGDVVCPGGKDKCADGQTCCLLDSGSYGCCPYPQVLYFFLFPGEADADLSVFYNSFDITDYENVLLLLLMCCNYMVLIIAY